VRRGPLVVDANVLIDYAESQPQVLALITHVISPLWIARPLLREVQRLDERECEELGLGVIDPSFEQLVEAGSLGGPLSFEDWLCLILARDRDCICVTNDRRLRKECLASGVQVLWGLELMVELVSRKMLRTEEAIQVARAIQRGNPTHITPAVIERFEKRVLGES